jgi:class 3 adenylate cyclase
MVLFFQKVVKEKPPEEIHIRSGAFSFRRKDPIATEGYKRQLTAIMSADLAGYSRLMGEDESSPVRSFGT